MGGAAPPRTTAENAAIPWWADAAADIGSAAASAVSVAPFITIVDMAVTKASAGQASLGRAVFDGFRQLLLRPHRFFAQPSMWMVAGVYGSTYTAANLIDSTCERLLDRSDPATAKKHGAAKLIGTTVVNMSAGITKDTAFARMYGAAKAAAPMPKATIGLFATRDLFTIGAAFTVPPLLASFFVSTGLVEGKHAGESAQASALPARHPRPTHSHPAHPASCTLIHPASPPVYLRSSSVLWPCKSSAVRST